MKDIFELTIAQTLLKQFILRYKETSDFKMTLCCPYMICIDTADADFAVHKAAH